MKFKKNQIKEFVFLKTRWMLFINIIYHIDINDNFFLIN